MSVSVSKIPTPRSENVVDRIIGHNGYGRNRRYIVTEYAYVAEDDTLEPAKNIL